MAHLMFSRLIQLLIYFTTSDADPTISTSTPTPCYRDVVTLVCHHPEVASNPGRYFSQPTAWREDGVGITPSDGSMFDANTAVEPTHTTLTINITVDHFRNKSFNYSCLLVLAENGLPTGEVETSGEVTVDPVDQLPIPRRASTFSNSTTAVLTVSFDPRCCNTVQLTVDITTTSSSATTPVVHPVDSIDPTNTTIVITDITEGVCYTASIQSVCEDNNLLEDSGVLVVNFMTYGPPEVTMTTTDSTITLTWNTAAALRCFESEVFTFVVIWNEIGSGTSTNVTTSSSPYTISGLQPGTSYQISVQGLCGSVVVGEMRVLSVTTSAETSMRDNNPATAVAIAVVLGIIFVAVVMTIVLVVAHCWKRRVQGDNDTGSSPHDPNPPASSNPFSGRLSGTCCYAEVDFESCNPTPIPPPPVEEVTYAEPVADGEKESQTNDGETKPELPTKQQPHHNIEDFRSDVVDVLVSIGVDFSGAVKTGRVPHFTAEYNGIHFVVTCVYTSSDVTLEDVGHVVEAKQMTGSTQGLLISNQSTIPSECLLTLEDAGCQFVPVSGYGEEGWEDRMIDKVKDVFPKVANYDSESEDLPTSEQETSPPPSCIIQPGTGPTLVQYNNSNNNNITDKRWTVSDEHCVESWEETPPSHNDCSTSIFRSTENEEFTTIVKNESYAHDDQNVKGIISRVADDGSEKEHPTSLIQETNPSPDGDQSGSFTVSNNREELRIPEQVVDSSPMVLPKCPQPPNASPPPDYQDGYSGVTSDDSKTHDDPFIYADGCAMIIVSGQYSVYMPPITSGLFMSPFEFKLSEEEEVLHKRVPWEEVEEEEAIPTPVQETTLTTHSLVPPSTDVSIANLEYPEEPLPTAASVASGECPEILPMTLTESSLECPDVLKADDSNISPAQTSVELIISESTDLPPVDPTPTQFSGKTYGFLGGLETAQDPSRYQQNWGLWTSKKTESVQHMPKRNDMTYNEKGKQCYTLVRWSAHLFQTALHYSGALLVV